MLSCCLLRLRMYPGLPQPRPLQVLLLLMQGIQLLLDVYGQGPNTAEVFVQLVN